MNVTKFLLRPQSAPLFPILIPLKPRHRRLSPAFYPLKSSTEDNESVPLDSVGIRFRRGARKRQKDQQNPNNDLQKKMTVPKKWEEMSFSEKAMELYVGEKGLLFWLNKFAYASIFVIIGGWILFRFVGPALNLYQLDSDPLPPNALLKS